MMTNPSVEIKVEPEDLNPIKTEQDSENEEMETEQNEAPLPTSVICERIVRKLLAQGKKYCSVCYDIFENCEDLSTHLTTPSGCQGYSEEDLNECDQSTVDFVNDFINNNGDSHSSFSSSSSSLSTSIDNEPPAKRTRTATIPSSTSNNNNTKVDSLYKCPFCPFTAPSLAKLKPHTREHITSSTRSYTCALCPKSPYSKRKKIRTFATYNDWFHHIKSCHIKGAKLKGPYQKHKTATTKLTASSKRNITKKKVGPLCKCPFCPVTAPLHRFREHLILHRTGKLGAYFCAICPQSPESDSDSDSDDENGLVLATAHDWLYHVKSCHVEGSRVKGDQYSLKNKTTAKEENSFKEGEKCPPPPPKKEPILFACSVPDCNKVYTAPQIFRGHRKVHEGEIVEYCCVYPECPDAESKKNWRDLEQFQQHIKNEHQNQRFSPGAEIDLLCTVPDCFKRFFQVKSYMKHVLSHQKKEVSCTFCPMKFMTEYSMKKHEELHQIVNEADQEEENQDENTPSDALLNHENFVP